MGQGSAFVGLDLHVQSSMMKHHLFDRSDVLDVTAPDDSFNESTEMVFLGRCDVGIGGNTRGIADVR